MIRVTNHGDLPYHARWAGKNYGIAPGKYVDMDEGAARMLLGYKSKDLPTVYRRNGWAQTSADFAEAAKRLAQFAFEPTDARQARAGMKRAAATA